MNSKELSKQIKKFKKIVIMKHERPDGDALGSSFGLKELIKLNFEGKSVKVVGAGPASNMTTLFPKTSKEAKLDKDTLVIVCDTANKDRIDTVNKLSDAGFVFKVDHHPFVEKYEDVKIGDHTYSSTCEIIVDIVQSLN